MTTPPIDALAPSNGVKLPYAVTLIPGDGIGPEVTNATVEILEATGVPFVWDMQEAGADVIPLYGTPLPDQVVNAIVKSRIALKGPIATPVGGGFTSVNVTLRQRLGLYANVRPARSLPGVKTPFSGVDIVVVRENSEDLYSGIEHVVVPGVVESLKIITEKASSRIARHAFDYARLHGRKKVVAVHKANIMKLSDGLFLECCKRASRDYPEIEYSEMIVDNCCMQLVTKPQQFDVMVMENLYGDIISDLASGLVGGLGVTGSANIGDDVAVYEAVHGSAPDIAGKGVANPTALLMSGIMMLRALGEMGAGERVEKALYKVFTGGKHFTRDLGGTASTEEFVKAVIDAMQ
ncbi:MAG: isocitrate/isopropylmalate dehydrogenase family protein [Fibrella sp.]|nr:isocitrate/isopropylmalate dehydrogenase family protein [Armatimonadota bacterium]